MKFVEASLFRSQMNSSHTAENNDPTAISFDYRRLRSWYLARLRQRIIRQIESGYLTPSSLIAADKKAVQNLILGGLHSERRPQFRVKPQFLSLVQFKWFLIVLPVLLQLVLVLVMTSTTTVTDSLAIFLWSSVVLAGLCSLALATIYERTVSGRLRTFSNELSRLAGLKAGYKSADQIQDLEFSCSALAESLSEAIERECAIADYALEFLVALDGAGKLVAFSPSFADFTAFAVHELLGRSFTDFVAPDDVERTGTFLKAVHVSQTTVPFENRFRRKDNTILDVFWLTEWSEKEGVLFCIGKDVSDQKRLERVRNEFISMVSHDLRTPLTSLGCTLELLSGNNYGELTEKGKSLLSGALESNNRLLLLIDELLDLENIEHGSIPLNKELTSLASLLNSAVEAVSSFAAQQGVEIDSAETNLEAMVDPDRLRQVIVNLLSNAIKFSPRGGQVKVTYRQEKQQIMISISDQGPGIPAKFHDVIFQRFKQVHEDETKEGSGLGLSICKAIVDASGGSIGLESAPGQGSTFWFTIPSVSAQ